MKNKDMAELTRAYETSLVSLETTALYNLRPKVINEAESIKVPSKINQGVNVRISKRLEYTIEDVRSNALFPVETIDQVYSLKRLKGNDLLVLMAIMIRAKESSSGMAIFKSYREISRITGLHIDTIQPALKNLSGGLWFAINTDYSGLTWINKTLITNGRHKYTYRLNPCDYTKIEDHTSGTILALRKMDKYRSLMPNREIRDKAVLFFLYYVQLITRKTRVVNRLDLINVRDTFFYEQVKSRHAWKPTLEIFLNALIVIGYLLAYKYSEDKRYVLIYYPNELG